MEIFSSNIFLQENPQGLIEQLSQGTSELLKQMSGLKNHTLVTMSYVLYFDEKTSGFFTTRLSRKYKLPLYQRVLKNHLCTAEIGQALVQSLLSKVES